MSAITATIDSATKTVKFELPLQALIPSKSGKSRIVATTGGNKACGLVIDGKPVIVGINAYIAI